MLSVQSQPPSMPREPSLAMRDEADLTCYLRGYMYPQPRYTHEMLPPSWTFVQVTKLRRFFIAVFYMSLVTASCLAFPSGAAAKPHSRVIEHPNKVTVHTSGCRTPDPAELRARMGDAYDSATMGYEDEETPKRAASVKSVINEETFVDGYYNDDDDVDDDIADISEETEDDDDSTGSVQSRKYMRRKRDLTSSENSNNSPDDEFLYQNMAYDTISKRKSRKRRNVGKFHPAWECKKKKVWLKMKDGYFPSRILDGKCKTDTCFFGIYRCNPVKYAIKVLKRDADDACKPVPLIGRETTYEESWVFKRIHVTVACECGQSWKKKKRKKSNTRERTQDGLLD